MYCPRRLIRVNGEKAGCPEPVSIQGCRWRVATGPLILLIFGNRVLESIMRTDMKVGVVAVLVLVLVVIVYFAFIRHAPTPTNNNVLPTEQPGLTQAPSGVTDNGGGIEIPPATQPDMGLGLNTPNTSGATTEPGAATQTTVLGGNNGLGEPGSPTITNENLNGEPGTINIGSPEEPNPAIGETAGASLAGQDYTIVSGDTLAKISKKVYGSTKYIKAIERANPGVDPRRLKIGEKIHLPEESETASTGGGTGTEELGGTGGNLTGDLGEPIGGAGETVTTTTAVERQTYVVQSGDTLRKIALKFYHHSSLWTLIYHANRGKIGDDPNNLLVGEHLIIPAH